MCISVATREHPSISSPSFSAHVDLNARNFFDVLYEELETFFDQAVDLEEVSRNQYGDRILDV